MKQKFKALLNRLLGLLPSAANDDAELTVANALDGGSVFEVQQSGTLFIPYGEYPHPVVGLQKFDRTSASIQKSALEAQGKKPIYIGHPDVPGRPDSNPSAPAVGWITGVTVENDGASFELKWGPKGESAVNNGEYRFYSPHWGLRRVAGGVQPVSIISFGLTNNPRIRVPAISNDNGNAATPPAAFAAPEWLLAGLRGAGFLDAAANDEPGVRAALETALQEAGKVAGLTTERDTLKAENSSLTGERDTLKGSLAAANDATEVARKARVDGEIRHLILGGKITQAQRDSVATELLAAANDEAFDAQLAELEAAKPALKLTPATNDLGKVRGEILRAENDKAVRNETRNNLIREKMKQYDEKLPPKQRYDLAFGAARREKPELF